MEIRQYALVKVEDGMCQWLKDNDHQDSPLLSEKVFVFLGEIPNMPEHCVIAGQQSGKVFSGFHISNFVELTSEEL